ncbi:MAG: protein-glutamate O-methyltransferase CheR [Ignavibacteriales bacterium]|nr:protein-glutamate O-methyltransferase CheR [Ignavibacteriales bacterium]
MISQTEIEEIELQLLLESVYLRYGYDFRDYARSSLMRRAKIVVALSGFKNISDLIPKLLHDKTYFLNLVHHFSITVTEMFRDPKVYLKLRETVFPLLETHPYIKIWHAGCATGEEVYSLAILLKEAGIYDKCTIFATDFNDSALEVAKAAIYRIDNMKQCLTSYQNAGGMNSFSEYYTADSDSIVLNKELRKNITFANHNLVLDKVFGEMHLILCRNVLIYFNKSLQNKTLELFRESLVPGGFLCIGTKESINFTSVVGDFSAISEKERIFRKKYGVR